MLEETIARVLPAYYGFCLVRHVLLSLPLVGEYSHPRKSSDTGRLPRLTISKPMKSRDLVGLLYQTMVLEQKKQPNLEGKGKTSVGPSSSSLKTMEQRDLLRKNSSSAQAKDILSVKKGELEEEIDESPVSQNDDKPTINIEYAMGEERLTQAYGAHPVLDYETLWYGPSKTKNSTFESTEEYWTGNVRMSDVESEMLTTMEAQEKFVEIQYDAVMGERFSMNSIDKRKLDMWIKFNPALFSMMEQSYGVTRDVNYAPL